MKIEFRRWKQRLAAAFGIQPDALMYTRKSTESLDRQVGSHEQQVIEIRRKFGVEIPAAWYWMDNKSGTTFDRSDFQDMLAFCQANPRPKKNPGIVQLFDPSRFGRKLDEDGEPDVLGFLAIYSAFENAGWQLHFVTIQRTGELLTDVVMMVMHAYSAALFSTTLSRTSTRGRIDHSSKGYWTAGRAPWGAVRRVEGSSEVLGAGQRKAPGGGGIILAPDPAVIPIWEEAARLVIGGVSLGKVGALLYSKGVVGPSKRRGKLGHKSIRNLLTNLALAGRVAFRGSELDAEGKRRTENVPARWAPLVNMDLFDQVQKELARRSATPRNKARKQREHYPLTVTCAACGVEYTGGRLSKVQGESRVYSHTRPVSRMNPDAALKFHAKGCKVWTVGAQELESKIRDLIAAQRTTPEFEAEVKRLMMERDNFRKSAQQAVEAARQELAERQRQYEALVELVEEVHGADRDDRDSLVRRLKASKACVATALQAVEDAVRFARSKDDAWSEVSRIIKDSRNIAAAWDRATPEERTTLIQYWVVHVMIVVQPILGMKRANHKTAVVTLRTAPNSPKYFTLDGQVPERISADAISEITQGSDSSAPLARSSPTASGEAISPSAQAACPRTSGSSSTSAAASAGTSPAPPTLPSTTDALRRRPRRLARFMGEPLNLPENSSCDMASSSSASDLASRPASTGLGEYGDPSASSRENLRLNGQTS